MYEDYRKYIIRIRDNLIQCGVHLPYYMVGDLTDYRELFNVSISLEDILYYYKILEIGGSEYKLNGFFLPLNGYYKDKMREMAYQDYLTVLPAYKKLLGDEIGTLGIDFNSDVLEDDDDDDIGEDGDYTGIPDDSVSNVEVESIESKSETETETYETNNKNKFANTFMDAVQSIVQNNAGEETEEVGTKENSEGRTDDFGVDTQERTSEEEIDTNHDERLSLDEDELSEDDFSDGFFDEGEKNSEEDEDSTVNICTSSNAPKEYVSTGVLLDGDSIENFDITSYMGTSGENVIYTDKPTYIEDIVEDLEDDISYTSEPTYIEDILPENDTSIDDNGFEVIEEPEVYEGYDEDYDESDDEIEVDENGFEIVDEPDYSPDYDDFEDEEPEPEVDENGFEIIEEPGYQQDEDSEEFEDEPELDENGFEVIEEDNSNLDDSWFEVDDEDSDEPELDENGFEIVEEDDFCSDDDSEDFDESEPELDENGFEISDDLDSWGSMTDSSDFEDDEEPSTMSNLSETSNHQVSTTPIRETPQDLSDILTEKTNAALTELKKSALRFKKKWLY